MDCERDGKGGIKGMLHKEYGARYDATDGTPTPLAYDMGRLTEIPPWTLGIV
jgi:hypothetical protein